MKAYIQSYNNIPIGDFLLSAYDGFLSKGIPITLFEDINEVPLSKNIILVAYIEPTNQYLVNMGIELKSLNIPNELMPWAGRKIEYMTMGEFRQDTRFPIFVKPNGRVKSFLSGVLSSQSFKELLLNDVPDEEECFISEIVDFVSEYRGYVINGILKGIKHYKGDIRVFPDMKVIDACIGSYGNAPAGYTIDFGITSDGRTLLVECNDGWSIGNYGLDNRDYVNLLIKRWVEIVNN